MYKPATGGGAQKAGQRQGFLKFRGSLWESGGRMTLLTIAVSVILVAALAAIPNRGPKGRTNNPAVDAELIRRTLATQAGGAPGTAETNPAAADSVQSAGDAPRVFRDILNPVRIVRQTPGRRAVAAPPRLPELSGVYLDGGHRRAVLDGVAAAEGDDAGGFRVHSILADRVVLERDGQLYTLDWKGTQP